MNLPVQDRHDRKERGNDVSPVTDTFREDGGRCRVWWTTVTENLLGSHRHPCGPAESVDDSNLLVIDILVSCGFGVGEDVFTDLV